MKLLLARTRGPRHRLTLRAPDVAAGMGRLIGHALLTLSFLTSPLAGAAQMSLDEVVVTKLPGDDTEMKLQLPGPRDPLSFTSDNPARNALDLADNRPNLPAKQPYALRLAPATRLSATKPTSASEDHQYVSRAEYDKLKQKFEQELGALKAQLQGLLEAKAPSKVVPSRPEPKQPARVPQVAAKPPQAEQPPGAVSVGDRKKEAEKSKRDLDEFLRRQKVLFKPGEIELEVGASYSQDTSNVPPVPPICVSAQRPREVRGVCSSTLGVKTRSAGTSITARYGLAEDVELNVSVPFTFVEQEAVGFFSTVTVLPSNSFASIQRSTKRDNDTGLSDISGALRYAAWHEEGSRPEVVLSLSAKSTTGDQDRGLGTGHWNIGGGVTLIKTLDPVVLFGSLGYTAALEGDRVVQGAHVQIDPGDQIPYSVGMGFSLNDQVSVSASLAGTAVRRTSVNGNDIVGSSGDSHALQLSTTVQVAKYVFVEPFVQFGLTADSTDFIAGISVPYRLPVGLRLPFHN